MKNNDLNVYEMIDLENNFIDMNYQRLMPMMEELAGMSSEQRKYILLSLTIPYDNLNKDLELYDNYSKLYPYDELKFINDLKLKYHTSELEIIERIKQVRKIKAFNQLEKDILKKKKKLFRKK